MLLLLLNVLVLCFCSQQVFTGNSDRHTIVQHDFAKTFSAVYVRIHPKLWQSWISLRAEFYGCYGKSNVFRIVSFLYFGQNCFCLSKEKCISRSRARQTLFKMKTFECFLHIIRVHSTLTELPVALILLANEL